MMFCDAPHYQFFFQGGLSRTGRIHRCAPHIDEGRRNTFRYFLDDLVLRRQIGTILPSVFADLIDVAVAMYLADRLAPREIAHDPRVPYNRWSRRISLEIPVRHPDLWEQSNVVALLESLMLHVSGDRWEFQFVARSSTPRPSETQICFLDAQRLGRPAVVLHSGGLDSLCGLISVSRLADVERILAVTAVTNRRIFWVSQKVLAEFQRCLEPIRPKVDAIPLWVCVAREGYSFEDRESSQRSRAVLYLTIGLVVAAMCEANALRLCENGPGAINLPANRLQVGARATRGMHPYTLLGLAQLVSTIGGWPLTIENTGLFSTKGELIQDLVGHRFLPAAQRTVSCERFPWIAPHDACGRCGSCLLRRAALYRAGASEIDSPNLKNYLFDVFDPSVSWEDQRIEALHAIRQLVVRLREIQRAPNPGARLVREFPEAGDVVRIAPALGQTEEEITERLLRLFAAYVQEMEAFFAFIQCIHPAANLGNLATDCSAHVAYGARASRVARAWRSSALREHEWCVNTSSTQLIPR